MVINLDLAREEGSHWVAVFCKTRAEINYFDSLGMEPTNIYIQTFLRNFSTIHKNKRIIQNILSNSCGHFCIYFVYYSSLGLNFNKILNNLIKEQNPDIFVKCFVRKLISQCIIFV